MRLRLVSDPYPFQDLPEIVPETVTETAVRVLRTEAEALQRLAADLPADFVPAVEAILQCSGRIILSGIGKSGHVARKISATLASTGTPSLFVHPAEASHGDLGMITPQDLCILISKSGETAELSDLIHHTRRFSVPLVAISREQDSTLMRAADYCLTLPDVPEACMIGMAPTTSTTVTLALGDALAVALMEQRGFVPDQFRTFHPGGKLGARLSRVHQLMHPKADMPFVAAQTPMSEALITMTESGFGIACVLDADGALLGVISDGDLRRNIAHLMDRTAGEVATRSPKTVPPEMLAAEALELMQSSKVHALVVVEAGEVPVGLIRIHDCLRAGVA